MLQHFDVPGYRRLRQRKRARQVRNHRLASGELGQNGAPRGIGERCESGVQVIHLNITNMLYYNLVMVKKKSRRGIVPRLEWVRPEQIKERASGRD